MAEDGQVDVGLLKQLTLLFGCGVIGFDVQLQGIGHARLDAVAQVEFEVPGESTQQQDAFFKQLMGFGDDGFGLHGFVNKRLAMKTHSNVYAKIVSFDNLLRATLKAQKGKKGKSDVELFNCHLEENLLQLQAELMQKTYQPGPYRSFFIHDPKKRMISAAPYRDRVVHHALCNVIAPLFEKTFIRDSYANQINKGTHMAIERYQEFAKHNTFVLKCDIRKFFPSIDHEVLKKELRWKVTCKDTLALCDLIIDASNPQEEHIVYFPGDDLFSPHARRRGLPIGNLTSQHWANVYLNRFDHFVKEKLSVKDYIRYVDDFVLFSNSKETLWNWKLQIEAYLQELRLILHPNKSQIHRVANGVPFLGFKLYPYHRQVLKQNIRRYRRFLRKKLKIRTEGRLNPEHLEGGLNSWLGHIRFGASMRLEYKTFWYLRQHGVNLFRHPGGSWRVLEQ